MLIAARRRFKSSALLAAAALIIAGCEDVNWDWEARWWLKPQRQVRPDRRVAADRSGRPVQPQQPAEQPTEATVAVVEPTSPSPTRAGQPTGPATTAANRTARQTAGPAQPPNPPEVAARSAQRSPPRQPEAPTRSTPAPERATSIARRDELQPPVHAIEPDPAIGTAEPSGNTYYQLYFSGGGSQRPGTANARRATLKNLPPRVVAQVVAQLYVPIGMGGGDDEPYLIFQDAAEFRAAADAVPLVDGGGAGFGKAMAMLADLLKSGSTPPREKVSECQAAFAETAAGAATSQRERWAAAMLAGRLASDQLYDYAGANAFFDQASELSSPGSVERLSSRWARAENLEMSGDRNAARQEYEKIASEYAGHSRSQAVQRAKAAGAGARR